MSAPDGAAARSSAGVVVDAGVLIAHLDERDALHERAEALLVRLADMRLLASSLTVAECLVCPAQRGGAALVERALERLGLERVPLLGDDAAPLAAVRASTRLRMPDAVVVHAAEAIGADLATTDRALAAAARERGLVVHEP